MRRTIPLFILCCLAAPAAFAQGTPPPRADYQIVVEDVALPSGPSSDVHLTVFVNEDAPCMGRTVFAIPGFAHTAATFEPLADALFAANAPGQAPCRVVAMDFPGHGESPAPAPGTFGSLGLTDYVASVLAALENLPQHGLRPNLVIAHSQGGLVVQMAQQQLTAAGSSLRSAFDVRDVLLLAPVPSAEVGWAFADSGTAASLLGGLFAFTAALGPHFAIPDFAWPLFFFTGPGFTPTPHMPAAVDVAARGYNAPEPFVSALQLVGGFGSRVSVDPGIFSSESGTDLTVVTFELDWIVTPQEGTEVAAHLTGGPGTVVAVGGPHAVHDMYVSDAAELLAALAGIVRLR